MSYQCLLGFLKDHSGSNLILALYKRPTRQVRLFADDTAVYLTVQGKNDSDRLQRNLDYLQEWEVKWDMEFSPSKCQVIHITRSRNPIKNKYMMHGQILDSVDNARYLGVDIADDLNYKVEMIQKRSIRWILNSY